LPRRFEAPLRASSAVFRTKHGYVSKQNTAISALCEPCLARTVEAAQRNNAERISPFHQIRSSARTVQLAAAGGNVVAQGDNRSLAGCPIMPPLAASSTAIRRDSSTPAGAHHSARSSGATLAGR